MPHATSSTRSLLLAVFSCVAFGCTPAADPPSSDGTTGEGSSSSGAASTTESSSGAASTTESSGDASTAGPEGETTTEADSGSTGAGACGDRGALHGFDEVSACAFPLTVLGEGSPNPNIAFATMCRVTTPECTVDGTVIDPCGPAHDDVDIVLYNEVTIDDRQIAIHPERGWSIVSNSHGAPVDGRDDLYGDLPTCEDITFEVQNAGLVYRLVFRFEGRDITIASFAAV